MDFPALSQVDFHQRIVRVPGIAIVCFTQPGCGSCRRVKSELAFMRDQGHVPRVFEVRADEEPALAREFDVFHLPALFVYLDGEYHAALHAEPRAEAMRFELTRLLAAPAEDPP